MISAALSLFLHLCMAAFVAAAPIAVADETVTAAAVTPWQYGTGGGIIGLIILILDIIVWSKSNFHFHRIHGLLQPPSHVTSSRGVDACADFGHVLI